ncbi:hypothetical protein D9757_000531 [Collybiopsis confluens]|uniref:BTB domain-containing protein n=1 Tax=Collybiopsis confluens TaxID=2823264 RepID=A0A8H5I184_9AGAR|nr:hypothetical protein D9757_000531 [Collybiopsis confluens]
MSPCEPLPNIPSISSTQPSPQLHPVNRHPTFSFSDGNLALLAQNFYFLVHQGLVCRHSPVLRAAVDAIQSTSALYLEDRPVIQLQDSSEDILCFLLALYDGISEIQFTADSFVAVSALIRLATKYQVYRLRKELLRGLSLVWPSSLASWDAREGAMMRPDNVYEPRAFAPHPILIINLARSVDAHELLPAAFYDLSRCSISHIAAGYAASERQDCHQLSEEDLFNLLKGREDASRFFSTFLVNQLEGRQPSPDCIYLRIGNHSQRRSCQVAFENIFCSILRASNSLASYRSCDPLFSIIEADTICDGHDGAQGLMRPCEVCRSHFQLEVEAARDELWYSLPVFFNVHVSSWG